MIYEYRCIECKSDLASQWRLDDPNLWGHDDHELSELGFGLTTCGPLKRRWSFGIAWPMSERGH